MALYPCSFDGARYRGASSAMYPAIVQGRDSEREHLRLCAPHFEHLHKYCREHLEEVVYDQPAPTQVDLPACRLCGGDVSEHRLVFVTCYPSGQAESQFYGKVCVKCLPNLRKKLLLV